MVSKSKQAALIAIGSVCSFAFIIVSGVIFSRYFDKGDYGTYRQVMYVYSTLLTIFTVGLPGAFAYFLPNEDKNKAISLINKINKIFFILGFTFSFLLFLFAPLIAYSLKNEDLTLALKLFSPVPFFLLPTMGIEGILATYNKGFAIALYNIVTKILTLVIVVIPVVMFNMDYIGAIICFDLASFLTFLTALWLKYLPFKHERKEQLSTTITYREIFKYAIPLLLASIWGTIANSADQFFISRYYGKEEFAEYANGAIELPFVGMIVGACSTVLAPVYASMRNNINTAVLEARRIWIQVSEKVCLLTYPLLLYTFVFSDYIMLLLYGNNYENSYVYFLIKNFILLFSLALYGPLLINLGKGKHYANIHALMAGLIVISEISTVILFKSPFAIPLACMISRLFCIMLLLALVARTLNIPTCKLFPISTISKIATISLALLLLIRHLVTNVLTCDTFGIIILSSLLYTVLYIPLSIIFKLNYRQFLRILR